MRKRTEVKGILVKVRDQETEVPDQEALLLKPLKD